MMPIDVHGDGVRIFHTVIPASEAFYFRDGRLKEIGIVTDEYEVFLFALITGNGGTSSCTPEHREALGLPDHPDSRSNRNRPRPGWAVQIPSSTITSPRLSTVSGRPVSSCPS